MTPELQASHLPIYVAPEDLHEGENVRPNETPEQHAQRVEQLAVLIDAEGQLNPIRIKEETDGKQVILGGQGRRDALVFINNKRKAAGQEPLLAWCVIDTSTDPLRRAIIDNFGRTNNSPLEVAALMRRVREQHGWKNAPGKKGEGANAKLAAYFGIHPADVTQYEKIGDAPDDIKARLQAGEMTMNGALTLLKVAANAPDETTARDVRTQVADAALEIATQERAHKEALKPQKPVKPAKALKPGRHDDVIVPGPASKQQKVVVSAAHIAKAAAAVTHTVIKAPSRREIIDELTAFDGPISSVAGRKFVQEFVRWADGEIAKKSKMEDAWVGLNGTTRPAKTATAPAKPVKAAKVAKPAANAPRGGKVAKSTTPVKPATSKKQSKPAKVAKPVAKAASKTAVKATAKSAVKTKSAAK